MLSMSVIKTLEESVMLVISGFAESVQDNSEQQLNKGNVYGFNLFSQNEELYDQLVNIEQFMQERGFDNIMIEEQELLENTDSIEHQVMLKAIEQAKESGLSGVLIKEPVGHTLLEQKVS